MAYHTMLYDLSTYCASDVGLVRQNNEDAWKVLQEEQFFVVADGMGGHQAGEIASKQAVDLLCQLFQQRFDPSNKSLSYAMQLIYTLIQEVNRQIYQMGCEKEELRGMGTTLCCLYFHPEGLIYSHVGDSRIYLLRQHHLSQLTRDHSLLQELIDSGQLSEQQAENFLYRNIITRAIGTASVTPSINHILIRAGDMFLMATDGLTDLISFKEIERILDQTPEQEIPKQLIEAAKQKGGYDNITTLLVKVEDSYDRSYLSGL